MRRKRRDGFKWSSSTQRSTRPHRQHTMTPGLGPRLRGGDVAAGQTPARRTTSPPIASSAAHCLIPSPDEFNTPPVALSRVWGPIKPAEHRRKPGGSPARLSGGAADAPFRDGPGFREAQGTTDAAGGGRAGVLGSPFFAYFLWRSKESRARTGRNPVSIQPRATARLPFHYSPTPIPHMRPSRLPSPINPGQSTYLEPLTKPLDACRRDPIWCR